MSFSEDNLVWVDLEMTGLDVEAHKVIEIATIVTDKDLNVIAEGPVMAIHQSDIELDKMDEWCTTTHCQTGLTKRVQQSTINEQEAIDKTIEFLEAYVPKGKSPMCGNSIGQDRRFMAKHMPELEAFFHYRNLDVTTLKILAQQWKPQIMDGFVKKGVHLALDDIRESIAELTYYKEHFLAL
jgi:oligoribonuclease